VYDLYEIDCLYAIEIPPLAASVVVASPRPSAEEPARVTCPTEQDGAEKTAKEHLPAKEQPTIKEQPPVKGPTESGAKMDSVLAKGSENAVLSMNRVGSKSGLGEAAKQDVDGSVVLVLYNVLRVIDADSKRYV